MAVLIDTSVLVDAERAGEWLAARVSPDGASISVITSSELLHGVHRATTEAIRLRRQAYVEHLLATLDPLPITLAVARAHAELWAAMDATGTRIGSHDLWIAATALAHGSSVATRNVRDFERVPGLDVLAV
jgi:predicted nucleic acid-binding protein